MTRALGAVLREAFSPLQVRNLRIYLGGQAVSLVGTWMQFTAQSWVLWELTRSPAALGFVGMLSFLPLLFVGPFSGVLADRLDRRRVLLASQTTAMLLAIVFALLVQTGAIRAWHIYVLALLLGVVAALDLPAQQTFIGDLVGMDRIRRAVVLNNMVFQASRMIGPMLAGLVIAAVGAATAFWLNALSFLAVIASLLTIRAEQVRTGSSGSVLRDFADGLAFIRTQPRLQDLIAATVLITFFGISAMTILPAVVGVALRGHADVLGLLMGASGAGALVGAALLVPLASRLRRTGLVVSGAIVWTGIWFVLFSLSRWVPLSVATMFMGSLAFPLVLTTATGLTQVLAPPDMRARLVTMLLMVSFGAQPIASLAVGLSGDLLGPVNAVRLNGLLMAAGALLLLAGRPALRGWEVGTAAASPARPAAAVREPVHG